SEVHTNKIVFNATHTHAAPMTRTNTKKINANPLMEQWTGLQFMDVDSYVRSIAIKLAATITQAVQSASTGGLAYGQAEVVIGKNRRWINEDGEATMYTPDAQDKQRYNAHHPSSRKDVYAMEESVLDTFQHVEGYEDHT